MNAEQQRPPASRAKSCTGCRQVKLACDTRKTTPQPCSRCKARNIECRFDANFKRVSTRRLAEEISNELHALRSREQISSSSSSRFTTFDTSRMLAELAATSQNNSAIRSTPADARSIPDTIFEGSKTWLTVAARDLARSYVLGNLNLDAKTVIDLFTHFELYCLPYAVFLAPLPSLSSLLTKSPLLFWTIALVAWRTYEQSSVDFEHVATEHDVLLAHTFHTTIQQVETIHALLILCLWPIPRARLSYDPSWNHVSLSTSAAMLFNYHSPVDPDSETHSWNGFGIIAGKDTAPGIGPLTWLSCFWIGTNIANFQGLPAPISGTQHMRFVDKALDTISSLAPGWWNTLVAILKISSTSTTTLGEVEDPTLHFAITRTYDTQLDELKRINAEVWTPQLEMELCNAKLYLFALTFAMPTQTDAGNDPQRQILRQMVLQKGLRVALEYITVAASLNQLPETSSIYPGGNLTFAPKQYFTGLFNATTFLFRFLATHTSGTTGQEGLAMNAIIEAHKIFQSFPGSRDRTRAAIHIEALVGILRDKSRGSMPAMDELVVTNRLGASVMFDAVFRASAQRNRNPTTGDSPPVQEWKSLNDTYAERLPPMRDTSLGESGNSSSTPVGVEELENDPLPQQAVQDPSWWGDWETYMDFFEVGDEGWPAFEQTGSGFGDFGGHGGA